MRPEQDAAEPFQFTISQQQLAELTELAGKLHAEAERCRDARRWLAALMLLGGSVEAVLLATTCIFEPELRKAGLWKPRKDDPTRWTLGELATITRQAGWLPAQPPDTSDDRTEPHQKATTDDTIFTPLDGQIGDAMKFVERLRNMIVHPGAYVREPLRPDLDHEEHMRQTYELIDGILAQVFDSMTSQIQTLPG